MGTSPRIGGGVPMFLSCPGLPIACYEPANPQIVKSQLSSQAGGDSFLNTADPLQRHLNPVVSENFDHLRQVQWTGGNGIVNSTKHFCCVTATAGELKHLPAAFHKLESMQRIGGNMNQGPGRAYFRYASTVKLHRAIQYVE